MADPAAIPNTSAPPHVDAREVIVTVVEVAAPDAEARRRRVAERLIGAAARRKDPGG